ncbi:hypothetical protein CRYUN_Cryun16bG0102300 [Craigia yunnanensis]
MKQRLVEVEEKIKSTDEQRREDSAEVENLLKIFMTEGVSVETLREKLSSKFPWLFSEESATNGPTADQDQGSLQTRKQLQYTDNDLENSPNELHGDMKILVCTALHEMQNVPLPELDEDKLKKWGATFNIADVLGFEVKSAKEKLKKYYDAYYAYSKVG